MWRAVFTRGHRTVSVATPLGAAVAPNERGIGLHFASLSPGGNAVAAGVSPGDICISINGMLVKSMQHEACVDIIKTATPPLVMLLSSLAATAPEPPPVATPVDEPAEATTASDMETDPTPCDASSEPTPEATTSDADAHPATTSVTLHRGATGLGMGLKPATAHGTGLLISVVVEDGLAKASGGINIDDVIIAVNGVPVNDLPHADALQFLKGDVLTLELLREPTRQPVEKKVQTHTSRVSVTLTTNFARNADCSMRLCAASRDGERGCEVAEITAGGLASMSGLEAADRLIEINGKNVEHQITSTIISQWRRDSGTQTIIVSRPATFYSL
jgi:C-terminal processing protease CtpA/Prc